MLKNFLPPIPAKLSMNQQSTVTVEKVHPDGAADIQHRFDKFEVSADVAALPENMRESVTQAQQEVARQMVGQTFTVHYDHDGRLVDFEGADNLFKDIDAPVREPLLQMLRLVMEQMGGQSLYPDHRIKVGEEWSQKLDAAPLKNYPFQVQGKSTMRYSGKTRYQGVKAAIVDYQFENTLAPSLDNLRKEGSLPSSKPWGCTLTCRSAGRGKAHPGGPRRRPGATKSFHLAPDPERPHEGKGRIPWPRGGPPQIEIQSETEMQVDGNKP